MLEAMAIVQSKWRGCAFIYNNCPNRRSYVNYSAAPCFNTLYTKEPFFATFSYTSRRQIMVEKWISSWLNALLGRSYRGSIRKVFFFLFFFLGIWTENGGRVVSTFVFSFLLGKMQFLCFNRTDEPIIHNTYTKQFIYLLSIRAVVIPNRIRAIRSVLTTWRHHHSTFVFVFHYSYLTQSSAQDHF